MMRDQATDNEEQIRFWNEDGGPKWVEFQDRLDRLMSPLGDALLEACRVEPGHFVLEIGCGTGHNTIELAKRTTGHGLVVGVDVSAPMLASARQREAGDLNVQFFEADAQHFDLGSALYDRVVSRFGVMFFDDPAAAFANLRRSLKPGGRLVALCWQSPKVNPWVREPTRILAEHVTLPEPPPPGSPGPFSLADIDHLEEILNRAGFEDFDVVPATADVSFGEDLDQAVEFMVNIGPTSRLLSEADPESRQKAITGLRDFFSATADGGPIEMAAATWIVTAYG